MNIRGQENLHGQNLGRAMQLSQALDEYTGGGLQTRNATEASVARAAHHNEPGWSSRRTTCRIHQASGFRQILGLDQPCTRIRGFGRRACPCHGGTRSPAPRARAGCQVPQHPRVIAGVEVRSWITPARWPGSEGLHRGSEHNVLVSAANVTAHTSKLRAPRLCFHSHDTHGDSDGVPLSGPARHAPCARCLQRGGWRPSE
jgi:hypothetical protein